MTWKSSWNSHVLAVVFYCQVYFTILVQHSLTLARSLWPIHGRSMLSRVQRKLLQLLGFDWELMKAFVGSGCGAGVGDGFLERSFGQAGRGAAEWCTWALCTQDRCPNTRTVLGSVLALLHVELLFGLAHLEARVYLECRPISNNNLSEVMAR